MRINVKHIITSTKIRKVRVDMQFHTFSHFITPKEKRAKRDCHQIILQSIFHTRIIHTHIYLR